MRIIVLDRQESFIVHIYNGFGQLLHTTSSDQHIAKMAQAFTSPNICSDEGVTAKDESTMLRMTTPSNMAASRFKYNT